MCGEGEGGTGITILNGKGLSVGSCVAKEEWVSYLNLPREVVH